MGQFIDLSGRKYGKLTVIKKMGYKGKKITWLCKCDCGKEKIVLGHCLRDGITKSCGCLLHEHNKTHGLSNTNLYKIYCGMKSRCYCKTNKKYKSYGGRGITMCDEWLNDFKAFYDWSMVNGYSEKLTIDRIDVDGNYEPSNCRWATLKEQDNNKRLDKLYTYNGKTMSARDWCKEIGFYWSFFNKKD